jgi:hypothetical protein
MKATNTNRSQATRCNPAAVTVPLERQHQVIVERLRRAFDDRAVRRVRLILQQVPVVWKSYAASSSTTSTTSWHSRNYFYASERLHRAHRPLNLASRVTHPLAWAT